MSEKMPIPQPEKSNKTELTPETVKAIGQQFGVTEATLIKLITEGKLNTNYQIKDAGRDYFLRGHRQTDKQTVERFHAAERYFSEHGIPVVVALPLSGHTTEAVAEQDGKLYSLYPWVGGKAYKEDLPEKALQSIARLQANIHLLSKDGAPQGFSDKPRVGWDKDQFIKDVQRYENMIKQKATREPFDELVLEVIDLQKKIVEANQRKFEDFDLGPDHLIHGDINRTNVFFDENNEVKHLFDSEHIQYSPRTLEVVRSLDLMCLSGDYTDDDFQQVKMFLQAYHERYPLDKNQFADALRAYFLRMAHYTWKLREHYDNKNTRVDKIFFYDHQRLTYMGKNLDAFVDRVVGLI